MPAAIVIIAATWLAWPRAAHAQQGPQVVNASSPRLRLRLSLGGASVWGTAKSGYSTVPEGQLASPVVEWPHVEIGGAWSPTRFVGIGLLGRALFWPMQLGRTREVFEVLAVPQFHVPLRLSTRAAPSRIYLGLPVGIARPFQQQRWTRAIGEDWAGHAGLSAGAAIGLEVWPTGSRWGGLAEIGYQARFFTAHVTSTLLGSPEVKATDEITYREHQLIMSLGLLMAL